MKRAFFLLMFIVSFGAIQAQNTDGDYRTRASGNWLQPNRWQVFYQGIWVNLELASAGPFRNITPTNTAGDIQVSHAMTLNSPAAITIDETRIVTSNGQIRINAGASVTVSDNLVDPTLSIGLGADLVNFGTLDLQSQLISTPCTVTGELFNGGVVLTANPTLLVFNNGSRYMHSLASGGEVPLATWATNSTCEIRNLSATNPVAPGNLNQPFGNFTWDASIMGATTTFSLDGQLTTVNGNLNLLRTNNREVRLSNGLPGYSLTVGGNVNIQVGKYTLAQAQSSPSSINIGGNFNMISGVLNLGVANDQDLDIYLTGNFTKSLGALSRSSGAGLSTIHFNGGGTQVYSNNSLITGPINFIVENGSNLDVGVYAISGSGSFTLNAGTTLQVKSLNASGAILAGNVAGNLRNTGARTFQAGSTVIYNGAGAQFMSSGHPSTANTIIDNAANVTMVSNATINGSLNLLDGVLLIQNNTLTVGGPFSRTNGSFGARTTSNLIINGSGNFADLVFSFTEFPNNPINNLTINRSGGTVFLGSSLIIGGTLTQSTGNFSLGQFSPYALTLRGNFAQSGGSISVFGSSSLIIEGAGTLPSNINMIGPNLGTLTMNRAGRTFRTNAPLTVVNLNLFNGVVDNPGFNITMASSGIVTRWSTGTITTVLGALTNYDVLYVVATDITTGNELPFTSPVTTRLGNLTKQGPGKVTLNRPIVVNKTFSVSQGTFDIFDNNDVAIKGDLIVAGTLISGDSKVSFTGNAAQLIDVIDPMAPLTLFDVEVNQSPAANVSLSGTTKLNIENSLAVNSASSLNAGTEQLRLLSTATRTANVNPIASGGTINGTVIVDRFLPNASGVVNYRFMASPVVGSTIADWDLELPIAKVFAYNALTSAYGQVPFTTATTPGRGFSVGVNSPTDGLIYDSRGTLAQGTINIPIISQAPNIESPEGYNLIGNPYPSAISFLNFDLPNEIFPAVYITDNFNNSGQGAGVFSVSYVDGVSTPAGYNGEIAQGQAFWVKATANTTLQLTEDVKIIPTNTDFYREGEVPNVLRIAIEGAGEKDEVVLRLREGASDKFDRQYDAQKFFQPKLSLTSFTSDNVSVVINAIGASDCSRSIPLVAKVESPGNYQFNFSGIETFEALVNPILMDVVAKKTVDLRTQGNYSFVVTDADLNLLSTRFQVSFGGLAVDNSVVAVGESICEGSDAALITINNPEPGVQYAAEWNNELVSEPVLSTGAPVQLLVRAANLPAGDVAITIRAALGTCSGTTLTGKPIVKKVNKPEIGSIYEGNICTAGSVTLRVDGALTDGWYHWYEDEKSLTPIAGQSSAEFVTPHLKKSKTYYAAAVNALGCEGSRVAVKANVSNSTEVSLAKEGSTLQASGAQGIYAWYLNDVLLEGEISDKMEAFAQGVYTVIVAANNGCMVNASVEVSNEDLLFYDGITVYPNPTQNKVKVQTLVESKNNNVKAILVTSVGVEVETQSLSGNDGVKTGQFDLTPLAAGIYYIRILDGSKNIVKKVVKVN